MHRTWRGRAATEYVNRVSVCRALQEDVPLSTLQALLHSLQDCRMLTIGKLLASLFALIWSAISLHCAAGGMEFQGAVSNAFLSLMCWQNVTYIGAVWSYTLILCSLVFPDTSIMRKKIQKRPSVICTGNLHHHNEVCYSPFPNIIRRSSLIISLCLLANSPLQQLSLILLQKLIQAVQWFGEKAWINVAKFVPGRTDTQCRDRWEGIFI